MKFRGHLFENIGVMEFWIVGIVRRRIPPEIVQNGLLTYFYIVRSIFLQRSRSAARRGIQGLRGNFVPGVRFPRGFDDEPASTMSFDGAALHDLLC